MLRTVTSLVAVTFACAGAVTLQAADWKPAKGRLTTRWAKDVSPDKVSPEYPRPQMVRNEWTNLNGLWEYSIRPREAKQPADWDSKILVPFPVESALSGVMKPVGEKNKLWYRRTFKTPAMQAEGRLLLHFGAVDWDATVYVNGKQVGNHRGGYTPFSFDITGALKPEGEQELVVEVWDPTDSSFQPRGKQVRRPEGIFYTAVTGIWQTVWLEAVPKASIESIKIMPDLDGQKVRVSFTTRGTNAKHRASVYVSDPRIRVLPKRESSPLAAIENRSLDRDFELAIPNAKPWTPLAPALYDIRIVLSDGEGRGDEVASYFAMRKIEFRKDEAGVNRLFLNNKPLFQYGPLDQGWWPDGLYTAPTDAALAYDIEVTKKLGMNMCRKHVKVEPARWYYHCDRLGLLVWQDMPSGDRSIGPGDPDMTRSADSEANYRREWKEIMDFAGQFPSVVAWVPFNEGWGQFKTNEILAWTKKYDPTRLVDGPSGWADRGEGDMHDMHNYPGPGMFAVNERRASVLGEFGGLGLPLEGHLWQDNKNWGYRTYKTKEELQSNYEQLIRKLGPLVGRGLAAAVYTQTTDVEGEVNGLMTYDREVIKLDVDRIAKLHAKLYEPQPTLVVKSLLPTSEKAAQAWQYTTDKPAETWMAADFDAAGWKEARGGFGTKGTPGAAIGTTWDTRDIWLRRPFELGEFKAEQVQLRIHHDEDAEIYLNGTLIVRVEGYTSEYQDVELDAKARAALKKGANTLAVHCRQTRGGQFIDVGLVEVTEVPPAKK